MSDLEDSEERNRTAKRVRRDERHVKINVGGTVYVVPVSTIMNHPQTMLGSMISARWEQSLDEEFFIDRDPIRFRYILDFYRDGEISLPITISKTEMIREADFFALPLKEDSIKFHTTEIISLRDAVDTFDSSLLESFHEEARQRSVMACAYEIAALLIGKIRAVAPGIQTVGLDKEEIDSKSFAYVLCPEVLNDPVFQATITGLVEQAGYHFDGEINAFRLVLSRDRR